MIKDIAIRSKLLFSFLLITLFTIGVGYYSTSAIKRNDEVFQRVLNVTTSMEALLEMKSAAYNVDRESISFKAFETSGTQSETEEGAEKKLKILAALERLDTWEKVYAKYVDSTDAKSAKFISLVNEEKKAIVELTLNYIALKEEGGSQLEIVKLEKNLGEHVERLKTHIEDTSIKVAQDLEVAKEAAKKESDLVRTINIIISFITVVVGVILAFFLTSVIDKPLRSVRDAALKIAKGDLSARVMFEGKDEIGELARVMNQMTENLQKSEHSLKEKGKEAEEKAEALQEQVTETEKTKKAVLNLLEDTREAEEKEAKQAVELKEALSKVKEFADVVDQERNMYLLLLASIGEGVLVLDNNRRVTVANRVAERTLGYKAIEMVGKPFTEVVKFIHAANTANKQPLEDSFWDQAFASKLSISPSSDLSITGKTEETIPIFMIVAPIIDPTNQESQGVIITFRDVREERALEEARIGFISTASHQLRTPLTSMRWFSEMLLGGDAGEISEEQKHFVERIYQGTDRMIALVNLLLQLARVEAGRVKVDPVPIDLQVTTEGVILTTKVNFDNKKQKIDIKTTPAPLPVIPMDQDILWQVIQNLLSNANRYAPVESTIFVEITQKTEEIEYTVRDTGIGIPENQKARLFEKFFRADNAVSAVPEGSGLGLSLVKILVEGWGGRIWFESEENKGTTFHFTIPLAGMKAKEGDVKLTV